MRLGIIGSTLGTIAALLALPIQSSITASAPQQAAPATNSLAVPFFNRADQRIVAAEAFGGGLLFSTQSLTTTRLWFSDGTAAETRVLIEGLHRDSGRLSLVRLGERAWAVGGGAGERLVEISSAGQSSELLNATTIELLPSTGQDHVVVAAELANPTFEQLYRAPDLTPLFRGVAIQFATRADGYLLELIMPPPALGIHFPPPELGTVLHFFAAATEENGPRALYQTDGTISGTIALGPIGRDERMMRLGDLIVVCSQGGSTDQPSLRLALSGIRTAFRELGQYPSGSSCATLIDSQSFLLNETLILALGNQGGEATPDLLVIGPDGSSEALELSAAPFHTVAAIGATHMALRDGNGAWWRSDGTQNGTEPLAISPDQVSGLLPATGDTMIAMLEKRLHAIDLISGIHTPLEAAASECAVGSALPAPFASPGQALFTRFCSASGAAYQELWSSGGTLETTFLIDQIAAPSLSETSVPEKLLPLNSGVLVLKAGLLRSSDGSQANTRDLLRFAPSLLGPGADLAIEHVAISDSSLVLGVSALPFSPARNPTPQPNAPTLIVFVDRSGDTTQILAQGRADETSIVAITDGIFFNRGGQFFRADLDGQGETLVAPFRVDQMIVNATARFLISCHTTCSIRTIESAPRLIAPNQLVGQAGETLGLSIGLAAGGSQVVGPISVTLSLPSGVSLITADGERLTGSVVLSYEIGLAPLERAEWTYTLEVAAEAAEQPLELLLTDNEPTTPPLNATIALRLGWQQLFLPLMR